MISKKRFLSTIAYIVILFICVFATIDTGLFVYPSLSRSLIFEIGIVALSFIGLIIYFTDKEVPSITKYQLFIASWILYIILYCIIQSCELYRSLYLCSTLILILVLSYLQKRQLLSRYNLETVLLVIAVLNAVYILFQKSGIVNSESQFFSVTGINENPTVTALYIVGCIPMVLMRIKMSKQRSAYVALLLILILCVIMLRCRTAYVGMIIEAFILLFAKLKSALILYKSKHNYVTTGLAGVMILVLVAIGGIKMYNMKKDSSDGRLLIWKLSAKMIVDRPQGYGYGLFDKNYNIAQASYFSKGQYTEKEKKNASFVYMPYNDYIEHGIEGGIIGMLFLAIFYIFMIYKSAHQKDLESLAIFCSFGVMSLFNFIYTSISPWLIVMCYASFVVYKDDEMAVKMFSRKFISVIMAIPIALLSYKVFKMTMAQMKLKHLETQVGNNGYVNDIEFEKIEKSIETSEAFFTIRAINNINSGRTDAALENIYAARSYTSSPNLFYMESYCKRNEHGLYNAVSCLDTLTNMLPHNLTPKYKLMKYYAGKNQMQKALYYADDILSTDIKVQSEKALFIINQAQIIKNNYE